MLQHKTTLPLHEIERINIAKFYTEYLLNLSKQHNITDKRILSENKDLFYNILFCLVIIGEATNITKMQTASKSGVFSKYGKGLNAVAILTAVGKGERPKLAENCSPAEKLIITKCWAQDPAERPTMNEVVQILQILEKSKYNTAA